MAWKEEKGQDSDGQLENTQHPACGCHGLLLLPGSCLSCLAARCCSLAVARRKVCGLPQGRVEQGFCSAFSLPRETSGKSFFPAAGGFISSSEVSCSGSAPLLPQVFAIGLNFRFGVFTHEAVPTLSIPGTPHQLPGFGPVGSPLGCVSLWLFLKNCRLPPKIALEVQPNLGACVLSGAAWEGLRRPLLDLDGSCWLWWEGSRGSAASSSSLPVPWWDLFGGFQHHESKLSCIAAP